MFMLHLNIHYIYPLCCQFVFLNSLCTSKSLQLTITEFTPHLMQLILITECEWNKLMRVIDWEWQITYSPNVGMWLMWRKWDFAPNFIDAYISNNLASLFLCYSFPCILYDYEIVWISFLELWAYITNSPILFSLESKRKYCMWM